MQSEILGVAVAMALALAIDIKEVLDGYGTVVVVREGCHFELLFDLVDMPMYNLNFECVMKGRFDGVNSDGGKVFLVCAENASKAVVELEAIGAWKARDRMVVLLGEQHAGEVLVELWQDFGVLNLIVACRNGSLFTYNPYKDLISESGLFWDKVANLYGGQIRISMFTHPMDAVPKGDQYICRDGWMAQNLVRYLNASAKYKEGVDFGAFENQVNTLALGDVANNLCDIAMNARFVRPSFKRFVEYTYPHDEDNLIFVVPVEHWNGQAPFSHMFTPTVALLMALTALLIIALLKFFGLLPKTKVALYLYGLCLAQSIAQRYLRLGRLFIVVILLGAFFINVFYQSRLFSNLTVATTTQIDTLEDLDDSNWDIYTYSRFKSLLEEFGQDTFEALLPKIKSANSDKLKEIADDNETYAAIIKDREAQFEVLYRGNFRNGLPKIRIMKTIAFPTIVCYITRYGSPIRDRMEGFVMKVKESGIQGFWDDLCYNRLLTLESPYYGEVELVSDISPHNLKLLFCIYAAGCAISVLCLVLEIKL